MAKRGLPGTPEGTQKDPNNPLPMSRDPRLGQAMPQPHIDPRVTDPRAMRYAQEASARRGPPKYSVPVAGGQAPPVPRLDQEHVEGMTMADQAASRIADRVAASQGIQPKPQMPTGGIVEGPVPPAMPQPKTMIGATAPGILASDVLPDAAKADPNFRNGHGSMFAANQPEMAYKYGVVRKGQHIPPQQLRQKVTGTPEQKGQLRPETMAGLQALQDANKAGVQQAEVMQKSVDAQAELAAQQGLAGQSADTAGGTGPKMTDEERKEILEQLDDFDFHKLKNAVMRDLLNNDEQREIIEGRLKPLDVVQLIQDGRVTQIVPVRPGVFEPEFQSYNGDEDLAIKRLITKEARSIEASDRYFMDKYSLMALTVAIRSINKYPLPDCYDADGNFSDELFWQKYSMVARFDMHLLSSLAVNWFWFDVRVRKLFVAEKLGNG